MPVKRRADKRRHSPQRELDIWAAVLDCGVDYFDELREIGVDVDEYGVPDSTAAAEAWGRFGEQVIAARDSRAGLAWGEEQFGLPWERRRPVPPSRPLSTHPARK